PAPRRVHPRSAQRPAVGVDSTSRRVRAPRTACCHGGMKVRIGVGLGPGQATPEEFEQVVDLLEGAGIDSLWLSEHVFSAQLDPFVGMAHALARTSALKVGTGVAVLPGRNPVLVAKQLA